VSTNCVFLDAVIIADVERKRKYFDVFRSKLSQQHGYNARNGYMPIISKSRTEWGRNKTYYKVVTDWGLTANGTKETYAKKDF